MAHRTSQSHGADELGMGWHAFRRFGKTWLRGKRCQEDINNFWMGHKSRSMSELHSRMDEELEQRLQEAEIVGCAYRTLHSAFSTQCDNVTCPVAGEITIRQ